MGSEAESRVSPLEATRGMIQAPRVIYQIEEPDATASRERKSNWVFRERLVLISSGLQQPQESRSARLREECSFRHPC